MAERDDGGPAFPTTLWKQLQDGSQFGSPHDGMSLRDFFAGQIAGALVPQKIPAGAEFKEYASDLARTIYVYADAMLAERSKEKP